MLAKSLEHLANIWTLGKNWCKMCIMDQKSRFFVGTTDGGSRGNPGHSASAYTLSIDGGYSQTTARYIGKQTNNVAEYAAVEDLIDRLRVLEARKALIFSDSKLVVMQMKGLWNVHHLDLAEFRRRCWLKADEIGLSLDFKYIPRAFNKEADAAVNKVLDENAQCERLFGCNFHSISLNWDAPITSSLAQWASETVPALMKVGR